MTTTFARMTLFGAAVAAALLGCQGPAGQDGAPGIAGTRGPQGPAGPGFEGGPSVSSVSPGLVVQGRTVEVSIAGFATEWTKSGQPTVDFGPGVTVKTVLVASDTGLLVTVEANEDAAPGRRNVSVSAGGKTLEALGVFSVGRAVELTHVPASIGRPAMAAVELTRHDRELSLPRTIDGYGFELPEGVTMGLHTVDQGRALFWVATDLTAPAGAHEVVVKLFPNEAREKRLTFPLLIEAAQFGEYATGANTGYAPAWGSSTATMTVETTSLVTLKTEATQGSRPRLTVLDASGLFADALSTGDEVTFFAQPEVTYYVVAWDTSGADIAFTLQADAVAGSLDVTESEPNDSPAAANLFIALPVNVTADLSSAYETDWFRVTLPASAVGKSIQVEMYGGNPDLVATVYAADGTTVLGTSPNLYPDGTWTGPAVTQSGVHYVRFSDQYQVYSGNYEAGVRLVP